MTRSYLWYTCVRVPSLLSVSVNTEGQMCTFGRPLVYEACPGPKRTHLQLRHAHSAVPRPQVILPRAALPQQLTLKPSGRAFASHARGPWIEFGMRLYFSHLYRILLILKIGSFLCLFSGFSYATWWRNCLFFYEIWQTLSCQSLALLLYRTVVRLSTKYYLPNALHFGH